MAIFNMSTYRSAFTNRPRQGIMFMVSRKEAEKRYRKELEEYEQKEEQFHKHILEMENIHKIKGLCMKGVLIQKGELKTGTSARGEWKMQNFVVEEYGSAENQYPQSVAFSCSGNTVDQLSAIAERTDVVVLFDIKGRVYNEKVYNELRAWSVKPANEVAAPAPTPAPAPAAPSAPQGAPDDLPW